MSHITTIVPKSGLKCLLVVLSCVLLSLAACSQSSVENLSGHYQRQDKQAVLDFNADGSCVLKQDGKEYRGTVQKTEQGLVLQLGIDLSLQLKLQDGVLLDANGNRWSKQ